MYQLIEKFFGVLLPVYVLYESAEVRQKVFEDHLQIGVFYAQPGHDL